VIPHLIFDLQAPSHYAQVHRNGAPYAVVAVSPAGCASFTAPDSGLFTLKDPWGTSSVPDVGSQGNAGRDVGKPDPAGDTRQARKCGRFGVESALFGLGLIIIRARYSRKRPKPLLAAGAIQSYETSGIVRKSRRCAAPRGNA